MNNALKIISGSDKGYEMIMAMEEEKQKANRDASCFRQGGWQMSPARCVSRDLQEAREQSVSPKTVRISKHTGPRQEIGTRSSVSGWKGEGGGRSYVDRWEVADS